MKSALLAPALAISALCFSGCGPAPEAQKASAEAAAPAAAIGTGTPEVPREVRIEVGDHMKFSVNRIEAAPGETLSVTLLNTGRAPKEAMGHNWVLLRPGADAEAFASSAVGAKATDYLPPARAEEVLAATKLLGGGARDTVNFTVPADLAPGTELVFLCTFPAHQQLGMKGSLVLR